MRLSLWVKSNGGGGLVEWGGRRCARRFFSVSIIASGMMVDIHAENSTIIITKNVVDDSASA